MLPLIPVLAEVGDKIPRLPVLFLWCAGVSLLAWVLGRKKKWFGLLALPLATSVADPRRLGERKMKEPSPQTKKLFGILICVIAGAALLFSLRLLWNVAPQCIEYRVFSEDLFTAGVGLLGSIGGLLYGRSLVRVTRSDAS